MTIIQELDRLRTQMIRDEDAVSRLIDATAALIEERDKLTAEVEELRARVDRLLATATDAAPAPTEMERGTALQRMNSLDGFHAKLDALGILMRDGVWPLNRNAERRKRVYDAIATAARQWDNVAHTGRADWLPDRYGAAVYQMVEGTHDPKMLARPEARNYLTTVAKRWYNGMDALALLR